MEFARRHHFRFEWERPVRDSGQRRQRKGLNRTGLFAGENSHRYPVFLGGPDDGDIFFYFARADRMENRAVFVSSLDRRVKPHRVALADGQFTIARDRPGGRLFLLTQQSNKMMIQTLDADSLTVTGSPAVLLQHAGCGEVGTAKSSAPWERKATTGRLPYRGMSGSLRPWCMIP